MSAENSPALLKWERLWVCKAWQHGCCGILLPGDLLGNIFYAWGNSEGQKGFDSLIAEMSVGLLHGWSTGCYLRYVDTLL